MSDRHILVVDDEPGWIEVCRDTLAAEGLEVDGAGTVAEGLARIEAGSYDVVLADLRLPDGDGMQLVEAARRTDPDLAVIVITAYPTLETAIEGLRHGAYDYLVKPFGTQQLRAAVARAIERRRLREENRLLVRRSQPRRRARLGGRSPAMRRVLARIAQVAPTDAEVLVTGPSGTGKELVARAIHEQSPRARRPFVPVDCAALPDTLVESELFGYERGAFTGATQRQIGLFEYAEGGTILLDEIGELPLASQAKLLRVLQERQFRRIGGRKPIAANVRVLAATNRDLHEEVRRGRFREDLYYRLAVFTIEVPPLRARTEDIPTLARELLVEIAAELGQPVPTLPQRTVTLLQRQPWPGNVRQLRNALKHAMIVASGGTIRPEDVPVDAMSPAMAPSAATAPAGPFHAQRQRALVAFESAYLHALLARHGGRITAACAEAGLSRSSLYFLLQKHGIDPERYRHP